MYFHACLYFICLDLHALYFMPCFPIFCAFFCSMLMLGLHAHMLDIMSMVMPCLDLHVCMHVLCSYAYVYAFTCLYAWVYVLPCLYVYIYMLRCISTCFHACMCRSVCLHALDWCSLHALCYLPCAYVLHAMFICQDLGHVCHAMCYCSPFVALSFFLVFWPIGLNLI